MKNNFWFPIKNKSHYSLLLSTIKPKALTQKCKNEGYKAAGLVDYTTISGAVEFHVACLEDDLKPIIGCEIIVSEDQLNKPSTLCLICKNKQGWKELIKIVSESNDGSNFISYPSFPPDVFSNLNLDNFIIIDGYCGSVLHANLVDNFQATFLFSDYDELAENILIRNWREKLIEHISHYSQKYDYYLQLSPIEHSTFPAVNLLSNCIEEVLPKFGNLKFLYENDAYYLDRNGASDQRVLIASKLEATLSNLHEKVVKNNNCQYNKFLLSSSFYIPSNCETRDLHDNHKQLFDSVEVFDVLSKPRLPSFSSDKTESDQIYELCQKGWDEKVEPILQKHPEKRQIYEQRAKYELRVIKDNNLSGYFLIVQDYINEFRNRGKLIGPARGCLCNTDIVLSDGTIKDISEVTTDDFVIDSLGNPQKVICKFEFYVDEILLCIKTTTNDKGITLTKDHDVLVLKNKESDFRWVKAEDITTRDKLFIPANKFLSCDSCFVPVVEVSELKFNGKVYDLSIENSHNYLTTNGIVHNSSAGCLVSFLLGITLIDPIEYNLSFERFFNTSRKGLPDIDTDFSPQDRNEVVEYIKNKYGERYVGQIVTFSTLTGKAVLKEVLRVHEVCSFQEMNAISDCIEPESKISDQLEEMEDPSIIMWSLSHNSNKLKNYCYLEDGKLKGDYAKLFEQAIRLEGTIKAQSRHSSAYLISNVPIDEIAPMIRTSKSSSKICGFDMYTCEKIGLVKFDLLSISLLSKIYNTCKMVG